MQRETQRFPSHHFEIEQDLAWATPSDPFRLLSYHAQITPSWLHLMLQLNGILAIIRSWCNTVLPTTTRPIVTIYLRLFSITRYYRIVLFLSTTIANKTIRVESRTVERTLFSYVCRLSNFTE